MPDSELLMSQSCAETGLLVVERWRTAIVMYSAAVSVKMNVLLMAPSVLIVLLKVRPAYRWLPGGLHKE